MNLYVACVYSDTSILLQEIVTNFLPVFKGCEAMGLPVLLVQQKRSSSVLVLRGNKLCLNMGRTAGFPVSWETQALTSQLFRSDNYSQMFQLLNLLNMGKLSLLPFMYVTLPFMYLTLHTCYKIILLLRKDSWHM